MSLSTYRQGSPSSAIHTLVYPDAQNVATFNGTKVRSIAFAEDQYDPSGTLGGGAARAKDQRALVSSALSESMTATP